MTFNFKNLKSKNKIRKLFESGNIEAIIEIYKKEGVLDKDCTGCNIYMATEQWTNYYLKTIND